MLPLLLALLAIDPAPAATLSFWLPHLDNPAAPVTVTIMPLYERSCASGSQSLNFTPIELRGGRSTSTERFGWGFVGVVVPPGHYWYVARRWEELLAAGALSISVADLTPYTYLRASSGAVERPSVGAPNGGGRGSVLVETTMGVPGAWVTLAPACPDGGPDMQHLVLTQMSSAGAATFTGLAPGRYWYFEDEPGFASGTVDVEDGQVARVEAKLPIPSGQFCILDGFPPPPTPLSDPWPVRTQEWRYGRVPGGVVDLDPSIGASRGAGSYLPADLRGLVERAPTVEFRTIAQAELAILWPEFVQ